MVHLANKTLAAIENSIKYDQGATYREWLSKVIPHIDDAYRADKFPFRTHMGASLIGDECARKIWYGFRWAKRPNFDGRLLRLFNRGHLEEARFIAMLLTIGAEVYQQDENGKQYRISDAGGHFGGSGDGIVVGIPELPAGSPALLEFKTSSAKMFAKVKKEGVKLAKFEHYVQMNVYMRKMGLPVALYMVVNKDNDELYAELIYFDPETADQFINRGVELVFYKEPPDKMKNASPGWFKCKFCDYKNVCHTNTEPERNCRTCKHSIAKDDGQWYCIESKVDVAFGNMTVLEKQDQLQGCDKYERLF